MKSRVFYVLPIILISSTAFLLLVGGINDILSKNLPKGLTSLIFSTATGLLALVLFKLLRLRARTPEILPFRTPASDSDTLSKIDATLTFLQLFLPARIMKEDAGDAREVIDKLVADNAPTWMIYTKLTSSVCWILLATVREVLTVTKKKPS